MLDPGAWSVDQVLHWAQTAQLSEDVIQGLAENQVDGPTLITLDKEELRNELGIRSLASRRYLWDLLTSLRSEARGRDYLTAVQVHEHEIESLERISSGTVGNPDEAPGGDTKLDTAVADYLHQDAARQRQIINDHLLALRLQRDDAGSWVDYENAQVAREEQERLEELRIQSEFDRRFALTLEGRDETRVADDTTVRDPTLFGMCVNVCAGNRINVAEALQSRALATQSMNERPGKDDAAIISDSDTEEETITIEDLPYIKVCNVCHEEDLRGVRLDRSHDYCVRCMRQTLRTVINDFSLVPFHCCEVPVDLSIAKVLLKKDEAHRLLSKAEEMDAKEKMYCPTCSKFINLDMVDKNSIVYACTCGCTLCVSCKTAVHPGLSCRQNKAALSGSDEELLEMARTHGWKQCPNCDLMIEMVYGCNHMTCSNCKHEFCFQCLSAWSIENGVSLCSSGCELWDDDRLEQAAEFRVLVEDMRRMIRNVELPALARQERLNLAMDGLRQNEECYHDWHEISGYAGECERCGFEMNCYSMACRGGCGGRVCYTCAHHRIPAWGWR